MEEIVDLIRALDKKVDNVIGSLSEKIVRLEHLYHIQQQQNLSLQPPWSFDHDTEDHDDESLSSQGDYVEEKSNQDPPAEANLGSTVGHEEAASTTTVTDADLVQDLPTTTQATIRSPEVLREAIRVGDLTTVYYCLEDNHVSPNHLYRGSITPLHFAVGNNQRSIVTTLLSRGADVNARDEKSRTPLHGASMLGFASIASLLLARGAQTEVLTESGETPLACAAATGNLALINMILDKGALIDYCDRDTKRTPLFVAALNGHVEVISLLLERGSAVLKADGWNAACEDALSEGVQIMVDRGANLQLRSALLVPEEHREVKDLLKRLQTYLPQQQPLGTASDAARTAGSSVAAERSRLDAPLPTLPLDVLSSPTSHSPPVTTPSSGPVPLSKDQWVGLGQGRGVAVAGAMVQRDGHPALLLDITNTLSSPSSTFAIKFEPNAFGLTPCTMQFDLSRPIHSGQTIEAVVPLKFDALLVRKPEEEFSKKRAVIQLEIKAAMQNMTTSQHFRFAFPAVVTAVCAPGPTVTTRDFFLLWSDLNPRMVVTGLVKDLPTTEVGVIQSKLRSFGMRFVNTRDMPAVNYASVVRTLLYFSWTVVGHGCVVEVRTETSRRHTCTLTVKSANEAFSSMCYVLVSKRLRLPEIE